MADLSISPEEIRGALDSFMESYRPADVATEEVGHVIETADGIAHVEGLPGTMANELLRFEDGTATWAARSTRSAARLTASARSRTWKGDARSSCRPPALWRVRASTSPSPPA